MYLLILTDSLYNDPAKSGKGFISEVRKEVNLALECEAANELNIVILCLSEFFSYGSTFHDYNDVMGWFFYTHTRSYSQVRGIVDGDGTMSDFSYGARRILRSMSLLETGMIETSVLMQVLKLKNRNEISELIASGRLDVITQTVNEKQVEFLCIHPIISLLMVDLLVPTEDNVHEMATHISESFNRMREKMTYADAAVLDEGIYYILL